MGERWEKRTWQRGGRRTAYLQAVLEAQSWRAGREGEGGWRRVIEGSKMEAETKGWVGLHPAKRSSRGNAGKGAPGYGTKEKAWFQRGGAKKSVCTGRWGLSSQACKTQSPLVLSKRWSDSIPGRVLSRDELGHWQVKLL